MGRVYFCEQHNYGGNLPCPGCSSSVQSPCYVATDREKQGDQGGMDAPAVAAVTSAQPPPCPFEVYELVFIRFALTHYAETGVLSVDDDCVWYISMIDDKVKEMIAAIEGTAAIPPTT